MKLYQFYFVIFLCSVVDAEAVTVSIPLYLNSECDNVLLRLLFRKQMQTHLQVT